IVLESATTAPLSNACTAPLGPKSTCSTALVSETHTQTASLPLTASAGLAAVLAPGTSLPGLRFQTVTSCPALTRFAAIGRPIIPNPKKAVRIPCRLKIHLPDGVKCHCQNCHNCHNCKGDLLHTFDEDHQRRRSSLGCYRRRRASGWRSL